jgi:hypothetical protein
LSKEAGAVFKVVLRCAARYPDCRMPDIWAAVKESTVPARKA